MTEQSWSGTVELAGRQWQWEAVPVEDEDREPTPTLDWYEFRFRQAEDQDQGASVRAGLPPEEWGPESLARILAGARERTWRDGSGRLWRVRRSGWPTAVGGTVSLGRGAREAAITFHFSAVEGEGAEGEIRERTTSQAVSPTAASDAELEGLLHG